MTKIEPNRLRRCALMVVLPALLATSLWWVRATAAEQTATVATEQLYVRRGPGSEFPPFATLGRGDRVEVHEVRGEWARIVTGNGLTGYVRSDFLSLPKEKDRATVASAATETPRTPSNATATRPPRPSRTPTATRKPKLTATPSPERPTRTPRLTATPRTTATRPVEQPTLDTTPTPTATVEVVPPNAGTPPAAGAPSTGAPPMPAPVVTTDTAMLERLRVEVARLTLAVEELRRRMDSPPSLEGPLPVSDGSRQSSPSGWSMAFAFGMIGALTGWILGASVGRRQERSQRSRIRF